MGELIQAMTVNRAALAAAIALALPIAPAHAQTAYDVNRLNQAVQICNSPMGAGMAECAQLRARLGGGGGLGATSGLGGFGSLGGAGKAAGIAGLLGQAITAARSQQQAPAAAGQQMPPSAARSQDSAMATYAAGQSYQACVAANPNNWQACLQTMNNNTQAGLLNAGVSPKQLQAAGGYVPPGYAPPPGTAPPNPFGSLLPRR